MQPLILPFNADPITLELAGGKGMNLARTTRSGFPVPPGFIISTAAYLAFTQANQIEAGIADLLRSLSVEDPRSLEAVSETIRQAFKVREIPVEVENAILEAYRLLARRTQNAPVAVRSSATAEDLAGASFAGQQETYLNIHGEEAVLEAVKRCWASLWTGRAISYRLANAIDQENIALAVIVQELVPAEAAGVMFTANPLNGRRNEIVINAAWGLGEAVVSGAVTPDTITVDKLTAHVLRSAVAVKQVMTIRTESGTREQPVPESLQKKAVLSRSQAEELARLGGKIEDLYGIPMDIEWAWRHLSPGGRGGGGEGGFAILQARPITALPEAPLEWKLPDPKGLYMRASLIEQLPEPLTPLFSTLSGPIIEEATRRLFATMAGGNGLKRSLRLFVTINGYGYMNVNFGLWNAVRIGVGQMVKINWIFKQSQPRWQRAHAHYLEVIQHWQVRPLVKYTAVELLNGARALFGETMEIYTVLQTGPIATALGSETMFSQLYNRLIKKKGDPDASIFVMGFESMPIWADQSLYDLAEWARSCSQMAAHLTATPAAQLAAELENPGPPVSLDAGEWGEWRRRFQEHLSIYGHFTFDLDFSKAVAADDPAPLLETCRMYLLGKAGSPYDRVKALADRRERAAAAMLKRLHSPLRSIFRRQMQSAQKYAPLREDGLSDLGLGYPLLRRMLRELGHRLMKADVLEQPDDVFWLTEQEAKEAAGVLDRGSSPASMRATVLDRREVWKAEQRLSPPVVLPVGSKYMGMDVEKLTSGGLTEDVNVIKGFGSSQGKVTAPACVLLGPQDFDQMHPGDVLVAPLTTPAWTPLFALASAIVTDIGGPLSHSSIVAREYGIPAVLGTGVATRCLRSGETVTVDGGAGTVTCKPLA